MLKLASNEMKRLERYGAILTATVSLAACDPYEKTTSVALP